MDQTINQSERKENLTFTGRAGDYFSIWIVNWVLSGITFGIWSAWATVRRRCYIFAHTCYGGDCFIYTASGKSIFFGRLVVLAIGLGYALMRFLLANPWTEVLLAILLWLFYTFAIEGSIKFFSRNLCWRGVYADWHGSFWRSVATLGLLPLLSLLTLGLASPWVLRAQANYLVNRFSFGGVPVQLAPTRIGPWILAVIKSVVVVIVATILLTILTTVTLTSLAGSVNLDEAFLPDFLKNYQYSLDELDSVILAITIFVVVIAGFIFLLPLAAMLLTTYLRNLIYNNLSISTYFRFQSNLNPFSFLWLKFSNGIMIIFTLGLLTPIAELRQQRYKAQRTQVIAARDFEPTKLDQHKPPSAIGEELFDFIGGFPFLW